MYVDDKYYDELFDFEGQWGALSRCGLKIVEKRGRAHVIVTELYQDNPGTSVTCAGKSLAMQICHAKGIDLSRAVYLECNPDTQSKLSFYDEVYYEVDFAGSAPVYRQLTSEEIKVLFE